MNLISVLDTSVRGTVIFGWMKYYTVPTRGLSSVAFRMQNTALAVANFSSRHWLLTFKDQMKSMIIIQLVSVSKAVEIVWCHLSVSPTITRKKITVVRDT